MERVVVSCSACEFLKDVADSNSPYVIRTCGKCGRKIKLREPHDNGHGIKVEKRDQFVFPSGWLQISANPLKGTGHFTRYSLGWYAKLIFVEDIKTVGEIDELIEAGGEYVKGI